MMLKVKKALIGLVVGFALGAPAMASDDIEDYVHENANSIMAALNDPALAPEERTNRFNQYMDQFTDIELISNFVIGKYSRRFSDTELVAYREAFRRYALTVYEVQLDRYRGEAIEVTGSNEYERYSVVSSRIPQSDGSELEVKWQILTSREKPVVVDVGLKLDNNLFWLAQEQRAQFLALLDQSNGSADALIAKLNEMTQDLESEKRAELTGADPASQAG